MTFNRILQKGQHMCSNDCFEASQAKLVQSLFGTYGHLSGFVRFLYLVLRVVALMTSL